MIPAREEVARVVLSKSRLCSYLLTSMIEWFTQLHYVEHVRDRSELDGLFRDLVKYHWMDEAQHAKIDSLLIDEIIQEIGEEDREKAVDELLELGGAVDGLLSQQADLDLESLEKAIGRTLSDREKTEIKRNTQRAYRWTFLVSGLEHPNFVQDRERADQARAGEARGRRPGAVQLGPETVVSREDDRLRPGPNPELVEQIRDVVADGLLADREALADVGVGEPLVISTRTSRSRAVRRAKAGSSPRGAERPMKSRTTS